MWDGEEGRLAYQGVLASQTLLGTEGNLVDVYTDVDYVVNLLEGLSYEELVELSEAITFYLKEKSQ